MDLNYSPEQAMLRESARRFLSEKHGLEQRRKRALKPAPIDADLWSSFAELGWLGLPFSEESGGFGGGAVEVSILAEEFGRANVVEPFVRIVVLAGGLVERLGSSWQRENLLAPLISGTSTLVLAHLENGARGRLDHVETTALKDGNGYRITGDKILVHAASAASTILVTARVENEEGIALFAVPREVEGLTLTTCRTVDGCEAADIHFDNLRAEEDARLGSGDVLSTLEEFHDRAVAAMCADAVGVMDAMLAATIDYLKQRVQFGKPLASFQALQHRVAEMAVKCEEARASALLATLSVDAPRVQRIRGVSGAKAKIGKLARLVAHEAIQLHGAIGYSEEMPLGGWFRRLYAFENSFGSTTDHVQRYASIVLEPEILNGNLLRDPEFA